MYDVIAELAERYERGETIGLATVVRTYKSAPRPAGAAMFRCDDNSVVGSVSGGCVEGAVYELAGEVMAAGRPVLQRYGVSDDDAFSVGLTCGGILDVFVESISKSSFPEFAELAADIAAEQPVALVTVIEHDDPDRVGRHLVVWPDRIAGTLGGGEVTDWVIAGDVRGRLAAGQTGTATYGSEGERQNEGMELFIASFAPRPRMLVFGAIDFAAAVARQGGLLGYNVTVCDARPLFVTNARFPGVDQLVREQPGRYLGAEIDAGRVDPAPWCACSPTIPSSMCPR